MRPDPVSSGQARVLSRDFGGGLPPQRVTTAAQAAAALVPLRAAGAKPPVFCVHAQAGHLRLYQGLVQQLDRGRPVYGLRSVLRDEANCATYCRFEDMAERYVREIRDVQPHGPYFLVGECDGAELAYEMAQRLRGLNEEVALLALVDSFAPGGPSLRWFAPRPAYRTVDALRMLGFHLRMATLLDGRRRRDYVTVRLTRLLDRVTSKIRRPRGAFPPELAKRQGFREALIAYEPAPYSGRVVLFRGAKLPWGIAPTPDLGWSRLVSDLEVVELPAYFGTCILEPMVGPLADGLDVAMDEALR